MSREELVLLCCNLDSVSPESATELRSLAAPGDRLHADRYRRPDDRLRSLAGSALLRYGLANTFGRSKAQIERDDRGRPYLPGRPELDFNIAHSGDWVLCLVGRRRRVGVDVEEVRPVDRDVEQYFAPQERRYLGALAPDERQAAFYRIWTAKEAYIKARGDTFLTELDRFWFVFAGERIELSHPEAGVVTGSPAAVRSWHFCSSILGGDYRYTCCYSGAEVDLSVVHVTVDELRSFLSTAR